MTGVEDEGMLHITLIAMGVEINAVERVGLMVEHAVVIGLSTLTLLVQEGEAAVEDVVARLAIPSVLQVELPRLRVVHESILVAVVLHEVVFIMSENLRAQTFREMDVAVGIGLDATHRAAIEVDMHGLLVLGLEILHVNLARHGLIAILHAGIALADLDALHPGTRHIP